MKITKVEKEKKLYIVYFDNDETLTVNEEVLVANRLIKGISIEKDKFLKLKDMQSYSLAYNKALNQLSYKMRTQKEMYDYLNDQEFDSNIINKVINKLIDTKYINDFKYSVHFVNTQKQVNKKGPNFIRNELVKKGVDKELINKALNSYSINEQRVNLISLIEKSIKLNKSKSINKLKESIMLNMRNKGYDYNMIIDYVNTIDFGNNEDSIVRKELYKIMNKLKTKYEGSELKNKVIKKMLSKGFKYDNIISAIKDYNNNG